MKLITRLLLRNSTAMPGKQVVNAASGLQSPLLSQAIKHGDTVYVSGNVGMDFTAMKMVEGSVADRTVRPLTALGMPQYWNWHADTTVQRQAIRNIETVLKEAGSSLQNIIKASRIQ